MNYLYNLTTIFDYCINNPNKIIVIVFPTVNITFESLQEINLLRNLPNNTFITTFNSPITGKSIDEFIVIINQTWRELYTENQLEKNINYTYISRLTESDLKYIKIVNLL